MRMNMKPADLTPEEIALVLKNRGQAPPPADDPEPEGPAPEFTSDQVAVLLCIDALKTARELYVPQNCLIQARIAQAQDLLLVLTGLAAPAPAEEVEEEPPADGAEPPESPDSYTVG
jgi:hypothetical protein